MNPPLDNDRRLRLVMIFVSIVVVLGGIYWIVTAVTTRQNTGILQVTASDPQAIISISAENTTAQAVGTGKATIRIKPGTYLVAGNAGSKNAYAVVSVSKQNLTAASLTLSDLPKLPSPDNINFKGQDALIDAGISTDQIHVLRQDFFTFKPSTQEVVLNPGSITPAPRNPDTDIGFTTTFDVVVDKVPYKATITYTDTSTLSLVLRDPQGNQVFTSTPSNNE